MYETGDAAIRDADGRVQIAGRMDDIINIAGHRISTAEIEDCVSAFVISYNIWWSNLQIRRIRAC